MARIQAHSSDSLNRISDSLNRKSIAIADSSMKISGKIAEMQEKFTKDELRAYIAIIAINITPLDSNKIFAYKLTYTNVGKLLQTEYIM